MFGSGNPEANIVIVGEAPGGEENQTGEPFVGPAGQLLDDFLRRVDLRREDLYTCNLIKCRPPDNRDPKPAEISACSVFLHLQLRLIQPRVIIAVGRFAGRTLTGEGEDAALGYLRKKEWVYQNEATGFRCPLFVTYHPSYILHNRDDPKTARTTAFMILADFRKALRAVESSNPFTPA